MSPGPRTGSDGGASAADERPRRLPRAFVLGNVAGFNLNWFTTILAAAGGRPWLGPVVLAGLVALHLACTYRLRGPAMVRAEVLLVLAAAIFGYAVDSALVLGGALAFPPDASLGGPSTIWMIGLWIAFACTLRTSMAWLRGRWLLAALFGAIGGLTSYYAGARLGAVELPGSTTVDLVAIGGAWLVSMIVMLWLERATAPRSATEPGRRATRPAADRPDGEPAP